MSKYCVYCYQEGKLSDCFIQESFPYEDSVVNRCTTCNQWSKNTENNQTEEIPQNIREGEWQQ